MIAFCLRRLAWLAITMWAVFTFTFVMVRVVPGGPFDRERPLAPEIRRNFERQYRLDRSYLEQYWGQLTDALRGDLGRCMRIGDYSVREVIALGLPISASLGLLALAFAVVAGLAVGVLSAVFRGSPLDILLRLAATIGIAVPNFVVAGVCIVLFVFLIPLFPAAGWGTLRQLALPAFCLGAPYAAYVARIARTSLLDVLGQDFIRTARAKGVSQRRVVFVHALRGALLPVVSFLGPAVAGIVTGSLVVEQIFAIPGIGVYFVSAAFLRDWTLSMGVVLLYTFLLYSMNFLVDVSYAWLDPRVQLS